VLAIHVLVLYVLVLRVGIAAVAAASSAAQSLTATTARMATPDSVRHLLQQHRSVPIIRPRLGAITARLRSSQVLCYISLQLIHFLFEKVSLFT